MLVPGGLYICCIEQNYEQKFVSVHEQLRYWLLPWRVCRGNKFTFSVRPGCRTSQHLPRGPERVSIQPGIRRGGKVRNTPIHEPPAGLSREGSSRDSNDLVFASSVRNPPSLSLLRVFLESGTQEYGETHPHASTSLPSHQQSRCSSAALSRMPSHLTAPTL